MSLFARFAEGVPKPAFLCAAEEWHDYCRKVWARFPAWAWDDAYLTEAARPFLPRIMAEMGLGRFCGFLADTKGHGPYSRAIAGDDAPIIAMPLFGDGRWMLFRLSPDAPDFLALDSQSHAWHCPSLSRRGADLVELGAWRWDITEARAAHRIARLCGLQRPAP